jgi:hypothetical protein
MNPRNGMIKAFVKDVLFCQCPDEVFQSITHESNFRSDFGHVIDEKLIIGDRLLIYIVLIDKYSKSKLNNLIPELIDHGIALRNKKDLNRFRLVLVTDNFAKSTKVLEAEFQRYESFDEKVHLHLINKSSFDERLFD